MYLQVEENKRKSFYGVDWQQKGLRLGSTYQDNALSQNIRRSHKVRRNTVKNWRIELIAGNERLAEVKFHGGIFQGDAVSPISFVIVMIPLNYIQEIHWWLQTS